MEDDFFTEQHNWLEEGDRLRTAQRPWEIADHIITGLQQGIAVDFMMDMTLSQIKKFAKQTAKRLAKAGMKKGSGTAVNFALRHVLSQVAGKRIATAIASRFATNVASRVGIMAAKAVSGATTMVGVGLTLTSLAGLTYDLIDKRGFMQMPTSRKDLQELVALQHYAVDPASYYSFTNVELTPELLLMGGADDLAGADMWYLSTKENAKAYVEYMAEYLGALQYNSRGEPINREVDPNDKWWINMVSEQPVVEAPPDENDMTLFPFFGCNKFQNQLVTEIENGILKMRNGGGGEGDGGATTSRRRREAPVTVARRFKNAPTTPSSRLSLFVPTNAQLPLIAGLGTAVAFNFITHVFGFGTNEPVRKRFRRY